MLHRLVGHSTCSNKSIPSFLPFLQTIVMENDKHIHSGICCKSGAFDGFKHLVTNFQTKRLANIVINCTIDVLC